MSFGGPGVGLMAARGEFVRQMPGRLVGETVDTRGQRAFVLTLATREQHIRRERATSNICTNNNLCALTAAAYLALLGGTGFRNLARLNYDKANYLKEALREAGLRIPFAAPTFNEFVVEVPDGFEDIYAHLLEDKVVAGLPIARWYPGLRNAYLLCVTETRTREEMDGLVEEVLR
jgi:glycine dehydrogenase subunit 1